MQHEWEKCQVRPVEFEKRTVNLMKHDMTSAATATADKKTTDQVIIGIHSSMILRGMRRNTSSAAATVHSRRIDGSIQETALPLQWLHGGIFSRTLGLRLSYLRNRQLNSVARCCSSVFRCDEKTSVIDLMRAV